MPVTIKQAYDDMIERFSQVGIENPQVDAFRFLNHYAQVTRNDLLVHDDRELSEEQRELIESALTRRIKREPLQHITGTECFMGLDFMVNDKVLIPRPDTEVLVECVRRDLHDGFRILDLCTGSGCILISLLNYSNDCEGVGVDLSEEALSVARHNGEKLLGNAGRVGNISWLCGDLYEPVEGKFDIIVSNPPYIASAEIESLMPEVRDYEPRLALDGDADGLYFYRKIIEGAPEYLHAGGQLFFEIGYDQGEAVKSLMEQGGFDYVEVRKDYAGLDRVVYGTLKFRL